MNGPDAGLDTLLGPFAGQCLPYDHRHRSSSDQGLPYAFESASRQVEDFFAQLDRVIQEAKQ